MKVMRETASVQQQVGGGRGATALPWWRVAARSVIAPYRDAARSASAPYRWWVAFLAMVVAPVALAYQVSVGTYVANAGRQITVPVALDSAAGLSYASATITYDPQVLVVTKAEAGSLKSLMAEDFVAVDTNGTLTVSIFGSTDANVASGSGSIANVTFAVREGTAGLYSDLAVSSVELGEKSGVKDVTAGNPVQTVSGMVRVMGETADVTRLENAEIVVADTALGSLSLSVGDAIQASDAQTAIRVSGAVSASGAIAVKAPANGWASGTYALLSTTTAGLAFSLEGVDGATFSTETANGVTTYYAAVSVAGEIPVTCAAETLSAGAKNQIRSLLAGQLSGVTEIVVSGPQGNVGLIADMGIAPSCTRDGTRLLANYTMPELRIKQFDPKTGAVRFKVTPGAGNQIVSEIATGYIHVYGTNSLSEKMKYISQVGFDLTPYLKAETKGEGTLYVTLGTHTFLKVKIETEVKED